MKVLVATEKPFAKAAIDGIADVLKNADYQLELLEKYAGKQQLLNAVKSVDALIVRSDIVDEEVFSAAENLKIVVRAGAGYDNIDLNAATAHNIVVMNTPGQNSNAVAELALAMMVYAYRNFFNGTSGKELKDKILGIHAFGNVGRNVARIAQGFGMHVVAFDPYCTDEQISQAGVEPVHTVEDLYKKSDIVSLHIPATAETKNSINYELMSLMPKGAMLVNTARKEVIDEEGLIKLMSERTDFKYVTDVMPACDIKLRELFADRYFSTPKKMGAQTAEANIQAGIAAARQIVDYFQNGNQRFRVNK